MVYHPRPPQSMLRTFLLNPFGMKIFLAQNTIYKWDWIGFFLDPSYKESIQHWLWGAGKNNFWQNLNVYLNENVFDDLIFIYRMKIHFGKDILSLIVHGFQPHFRKIFPIVLRECWSNPFLKLVTVWEPPDATQTIKCNVFAKNMASFIWR